MPTPSFVAGGTINPSVFVYITGSNTVSQASASTQKLIGISQEWSKFAPIPGATSEAANVNDQITIYGLEHECLLNATSNGWTAGDRLTATTGGYGATASTDGNFFGAIALSTMTGVGLGRVQVVLGQVAA